MIPGPLPPLGIDSRSLIPLAGRGRDQKEPRAETGQLLERGSHGTGGKRTAPIEATCAILFVKQKKVV